VLFATPHIEPDLQQRLDQLDALRRDLGQEVSRPTRWMGVLRRSVRAASIEGSTSIEGYSVSPEEALDLVGGGARAEPESESRMAVACYARAMDHVVALARDPSFRWLDRVILDLHFDACHFQPGKSPGLWRTDAIGATADDGSLAYRGPDAKDVPALMAEVVSWLEQGDLDAHIVVRAAMAHLHVTSVHPCRDGNGRVSRIVQSLVLAREGMLSPEFSSIEEYLGEHANDYYAALRKVQGGSYQPERDATAWVSFCVDAHIAQARQRLAQINEAAQRWDKLEAMVEARGWPDRMLIALEQSLAEGTDRGRYGREADISLATASGDFRRLLDAGLVEQRGNGRSTRYFATDQLRAGVAAQPPAFSAS
jgi:Fic family protein